MLTAPSTAPFSLASACRVCGNTDLRPYLDLGEQPLANALLTKDGLDKPELRVPLVIQACLECGLSQLTHIVRPEILYDNYPYFSGVSAGWRDHCADLAEEFGEPGRFVLDIASNDGTLLKAFARRGCQVMGVDPAPVFAGCGVPTVTAQWSTSLARMRMGGGNFDIITATNVLGHVDNIHDFLKGVEFALGPYGTAIFEMPHLLVLLEQNAFDTIYHEHLSYWGLRAFQRALQPHGLHIFDVRFLPRLHGGTMAYYVSKQRQSRTAFADYWVDRESALLRRDTYEQFASQIATVRAQLADALREVEWGFGAAAKATVLLNAVPIPKLKGILDDSSAKQGKFVPGVHVPIVSPKTVNYSQIDTLVLFAWNWTADLVPKLRREGFRGEFLVPLPQPRRFSEWLRDS